MLKEILAKLLGEDSKEPVESINELKLNSYYDDVIYNINSYNGFSEGQRRVKGYANY